MRYDTDDLRIREIKELVPPAHVLREFPISEKGAKTTYEARQAVQQAEMMQQAMKSQPLVQEGIRQAKGGDA